MESGAAPVFLDVSDLVSLLAEKTSNGKDVRIFDCTQYFTAEEGCMIVHYNEKHIPTAEYLDLRYIRDMAKPYPYMMPSQQ